MVQNEMGCQQEVKVGQLVEYTHWQFDPLLTPKVKYGIVKGTKRNRKNVGVVW